MKENIAYNIRRCAALVCACLLLLCAVPVGLISHPTTVSAEGEFMKISPVAETFVSGKANENGKTGEEMNPRIHLVGADYDAYLRFELGQLMGRDIEDVKSAKLRLALVRGGGETASPICVSLMENNSWNDGITGRSKPPVVGEVELVRSPTDFYYAKDSVLELDLTEYLRNWIENQVTQVSLHLSGTGASAMAIASGGYEDKAYRPYLKIVTGDAVDTDPATLDKTYLEEDVFVSRAAAQSSGAILVNQWNELLAGRGREIYLKFRLEPGNIQGAIHQASIALSRPLNAIGAVFRVYWINNNDWNREGISYDNRPVGEEILALEGDASQIDWRELDVSYVVMDAYARGEDTVTFRITAEGENLLAFQADGVSAPRLKLKVSDDSHTMAAAEAAVHALGNNANAGFVTMDLTDSYVAGDGTKASISWKAYDPETGLENQDTILSDGTITRPKWFEGTRKVEAAASIRSGSCQMRRTFMLTLPAETAPDYQKKNFGNYIDVGASDSEEAARVETVRSGGAKSRWVEGTNFTYRVLGETGAMVLNLACDPTHENYLTLKLWEADAATRPLWLTACTEPGKEQMKPMILRDMNSARTEDGFVYATYALPEAYTKGKTYVSLRLYHKQAEIAEDGTALPPFESCGIYGIYMTQSSYFEPKAFVEQGEVIPEKRSSNARSFYQFLKRLYLVSQQFPFGGGEEEPGQPGVSSADEVSDVVIGPQPESPLNPGRDGEAVTLKQEEQAACYGWIDQTTGTIILKDGEDRIAFAVGDNREVTIHHSTPYYDKYCMGSFGNPAEKVAAIDYGPYQLMRNLSDSQVSVPYRELELSGVYRDLMTGVYYAFLDEGQIADDSVLPKDAVLKDGKQAILEPGADMALSRLAEPLHDFDWRIHAVNDTVISQFTLADQTSIDSVSFKAVGSRDDARGMVTVLCGIYEQEKLVGFAVRELPVQPEVETYTADFSGEGLFVGTNQTLKIFVEDDMTDFLSLTPKLELP